ncbi:MAG TPA: PQQ-dependent sugar dehydrogenase [Pirellulales bacterium]|jgi:glucose/arabinose dehydrogenase|nr:PQQ-dependent sugar dehydrogenase [Pirellulales bacterium]
MRLCGSSLIALLSATALFVLAAPLLRAADEADPVATVARLNSSFPPERLDPAEWQIKERVLGSQRQMDFKPVVAEAIVRVKDTYYIAERGSPRWLVGNRTVEKSGPTKQIRCIQAFDNLDRLIKASQFADLPKPPEGFTLRAIATLPVNPSRLASDGRGKVLYALCERGDVWRIEPESGAQRQLLQPSDYIDPKLGDSTTMGMTLDKQNRLYIITNQQDSDARPRMNRVTIWRTTKVVDGDPADPQPWLRATYPWGIGPFNHGVGHIATGPDGMLYVSSGSRTDGNEQGSDDRYWKGGEHELTACIWRLDPNAAEPKIEIYARGLRNPYGFCWDPSGRMLATDNGPDADPPEELNVIERGKHYGFPFKFSDWPNKPYPYTPNPPNGQEFTLPVANLGPAAGGSEEKPLYTFDPHSSPSGIVYLGDDFPPPYRGGFFVTRFGNLLKRPKDVGFDLLHIKLEQNTKGEFVAHTMRVLFPVARPVDVHLSGKGRVYICEYARQIENGGFVEMLPGRILELAVKP